MLQKSERINGIINDLHEKGVVDSTDKVEYRMNYGNHNKLSGHGS
jgi:hypothetical protein